MENNDVNDVLVYRLGAGCDLADVAEGNIYQGKVQGFANFGMFVQLNDRIKGLVHKSNMKGDHKERDSILVRVRQIRPNGNIDLEEWRSRCTRYRTWNGNPRQSGSRTSPHEWGRL